MAVAVSLPGDRYTWQVVDGRVPRGSIIRSLVAALTDWLIHIEWYVFSQKESHLTHNVNVNVNRQMFNVAKIA